MSVMKSAEEIGKKLSGKHKKTGSERGENSGGGDWRFLGNPKKKTFQKRSGGGDHFERTSPAAWGGDWKGQMKKGGQENGNPNA